jgi:hypothetical protein
LNRENILRQIELAVMVEEHTLLPQTKLADLEEWDSLTKATLLSYLGSEYEHLDLSVFRNLETVEDVINTILISRTD